MSNVTNNSTPAPDPRQIELDLYDFEFRFLRTIWEAPLQDAFVKHLRPESRAAFNILKEFEYIHLSKWNTWVATADGEKLLKAVSRA